MPLGCCVRALERSRFIDSRVAVEAPSFLAFRGSLSRAEFGEAKFARRASEQQSQKVAAYNAFRDTPAIAGVKSAGDIVGSLLRNLQIHPSRRNRHPVVASSTTIPTGRITKAFILHISQVHTR